jgi:hypothetical protein
LGYDSAMDEQQQKELQLLIDKRWDPVRGVGKSLGTLRKIFIVLFGISIVVGPYTGIPMVYIFVAIPLLLCFVKPAWLHQKTLKRTRANEWFLCPWCRYALSGLDEEGVCPECDSRYRKDMCVMLYQCAYPASFKPSPQMIKERESKAWREAIELRDGANDE